MTTVTTEELEAIRELREQRDELASALRDMVCAYTATGGASGSLEAAAFEQAKAALARLA